MNWPHRLRSLFAYLLLGAIINVAIAWGCSLLIPLPQMEKPPLAMWEEPTTRRAAEHREANGICLVTYLYVRLARSGAESPPLQDAFGELPAWSYFGKIQRGRPENPKLFPYAEKATGWPLVNMTCAFRPWVVKGEVIILSEWAVRAGPISQVAEASRALPLRPIPAAMIFNVCFYAAAVWVLRMCCGFIRCVVRATRHQCPACGYLIGSGPVCTECGNPVSHRMYEDARMRLRRLRTLLVLVLLGAVMNIAAAWACAAWVDVSGSPLHFYDTQHTQGNLWDPQNIWDTYSIQNGFGHTRINYMLNYHAENASPEISHLPYFAMADWPSVDQGEDYAGWPCRSFGCRRIGQSTFMRTDATSVLLVSGIELKPLSTAIAEGWRALPYRPIWRGVVINTIFYAGVLWLLFAAPFALRRRRRVKRDLCAAFTYPIKTSEACTECSASVPTTQRADSPAAC